MGVNRYDNFRPLQFNLSGFPVEQLAYALKGRRLAYDKAEKEIEDLGLLRVEGIDGTTYGKRAGEINAQLNKQYSDVLGTINDNYGGDYSKAADAIGSLRRNLKKDFTTGEAAQLNTMYKNYAETYKDVMKNDNIPSNYKQIALAKFQQANSRPDKWDPVAGRYSNYTPFTTPPVGVNFFDEIVKGVKAIDPSITIEHKAGQVGFSFYDAFTKREIKDANRIRGIVEMVIGSNSKAQDAIKFEAEAEGKTYEQKREEIIAPSSNFAYDNITDRDINYRDNKAAIMEAEFKYKLRENTHKAKLERDNLEAVFNPAVELNPVTNDLFPVNVKEVEKSMGLGDPSKANVYGQSILGNASGPSISPGNNSSLKLSGMSEQEFIKAARDAGYANSGASTDKWLKTMYNNPQNKKFTGQQFFTQFNNKHLGNSGYDMRENGATYTSTTGYAVTGNKAKDKGDYFAGNADLKLKTYDSKGALNSKITTVGEANAFENKDATSSSSRWKLNPSVYYPAGALDARGVYQIAGNSGNTYHVEDNEQNADPMYNPYSNFTATFEQKLFGRYSGASRLAEGNRPMPIALDNPTLYKLIPQSAGKDVAVQGGAAQVMLVPKTSNLRDGEVTYDVFAVNKQGKLQIVNSNVKINQDDATSIASPNTEIIKSKVNIRGEAYDKKTGITHQYYKNN